MLNQKAFNFLPFLFMLEECVDAGCVKSCGESRVDYQKIGDFISALSSDKRVCDMQVYGNRVTVSYRI